VSARRNMATPWRPKLGVSFRQPSRGQRGRRGAISMSVSAPASRRWGVLPLNCRNASPRANCPGSTDVHSRHQHPIRHDISTQAVPRLAAWIARQPTDLLFKTSVSQAEILSGLAIMFLEDFEGRVLPFDMDAAIAYADIFAARRRAGRPSATVDLMIASVARSHNASVVTRDISGFEGCGLTVINPWDAT
jgi:predicted nucleic acid-binding protein